MYATDYFESGVLNSFRGQNFSAPTTIYMALFLTSPTDSGTAGTEVSYGLYARQVITFSAPTGANRLRQIANNAAVTFPAATTAGGTAQFLAFYDSLTGGNMLAYSQLSSPVNIGVGEAPSFQPGDVVLSLQNDFSNALKTRILNVFRSTSMLASIAHMALFNGSPEDGGAELSGALYARLPVTFSAPVVAGTAQRINSTADMKFSRANETWGTVNFLALFDSPTGGNAISYKQVEAKDVFDGRQVGAQQNAVYISFN